MNQTTVWRKRIVPFLGLLIAVVSLASIGYQLWQMWPRLAALEIQPVLALLALLAGCLSLVIPAVLWRTMLHQAGISLSLSKSMYIWFASQVVRYAPGNVWHILGRVYLGQREGLDTLTVSFSMVLELMQSITAALLVGAVSLLFWPQQNVFSLWVLLLIPLLVCYIWPHTIHYPLVWIFRRKNQPLPERMLKRRDMLLLLPGYCLHWAVYGVGFYLLVQAVYPLPIGAMPSLIGIFSIAWVVGFLSFITPSGLGVREGVLSYLLSFLVPVPVALLLSLLARVWVTLAELGCVVFVVVRKQWTHEPM